MNLSAGVDMDVPLLSITFGDTKAHMLQSQSQHLFDADFSS
jgi:hypothetical protein